MPKVMIAAQNLVIPEARIASSRAPTPWKATRSDACVQVVGLIADRTLIVTPRSGSGTMRAPRQPATPATLRRPHASARRPPELPPPVVFRPAPPGRGAWDCVINRALAVHSRVAEFRSPSPARACTTHAHLTSDTRRRPHGNAASGWRYPTGAGVFALRISRPGRSRHSPPPSGSRCCSYLSMLGRWHDVTTMVSGKLGAEAGRDHIPEPSSRGRVALVEEHHLGR